MKKRPQRLLSTERRKTNLAGNMFKAWMTLGVGDCHPDQRVCPLFGDVFVLLPHPPQTRPISSPHPQCLFAQNGQSTSPRPHPGQGRRRTRPCRRWPAQSPSCRTASVHEPSGAGTCHQQAWAEVPVPSLAAGGPPAPRIPGRPPALAPTPGKGGHGGRGSARGSAVSPQAGPPRPPREPGFPELVPPTSRRHACPRPASTTLQTCPWQQPPPARPSHARRRPNHPVFSLPARRKHTLRPGSTSHYPGRRGERAVPASARATTSACCRRSGLRRCQWRATPGSVEGGSGPGRRRGLGRGAGRRGDHFD